MKIPSISGGAKKQFTSSWVQPSSLVQLSWQLASLLLVLISWLQASWLPSLGSSWLLFFFGCRLLDCLLRCLLCCWFLCYLFWCFLGSWLLLWGLWLLTFFGFSTFLTLNDPFDPTPLGPFNNYVTPTQGNGGVFFVMERYAILKGGWVFLILLL